MKNKDSGFWMLQASGWLLFLYLVYAQAIPAFDYQLGVSMGTQEPATQITEVGVAFYRGFSIGDLLVYLPTLAIGLIGYWANKSWGRIVLAAALGITIYWPVVCLAAIFAAREAVGWSLPGERSYWVVLPIIVLWSMWGLWLIAHQPKHARRS